MRTFKAYVRDGRLVMNEPTGIPEGSKIELVVADDGDDLDDEERQRLHRALARSWASAKQGNTRPAREVIRKLKGGE